MFLKADSLHELPLGAEYRKKNGRASATVKNEGGQLVVYATCDSLQCLVDFYQRTTAKQASDIQQLTALHNQQQAVEVDNEHRCNPVRIALIAFIVGLATGAVVTFIKR